MTSPPTTSQSTQTSDELEEAQDSVPQTDSMLPDHSIAATNAQKSSSQSRPLRIYTRPQLLSLSHSPMVKPPPDMPELKAWFGTGIEDFVNKKDEPTTPGTARERRFRRDAEDGDAPSRPAFRSTLQPSQMGNFKHQSLRERDKDKDGDKERERDIRDKEGQERLRHLSDKYDRDRLLPLSSSRNKDRDSAPHLNSSNSRGQQPAPQNGVSRRSDTREGSKKKGGETGEDWRRENARSNREERGENGRRDREDRDRARSKARDSSRPKRETSPSRKERDRDEPRDHRRERDDDEDARHWRDDGRRDERMAARRDRDRTRGNHDRDQDDRRWTTADERYKRAGGGRDRKGVSGGDDAKEKEDRREKEKEPAWMDTYIPSDPSAGILGGQAANGELDGIQAWKKGLKEKETKEKEKETTVAPPSAKSGPETAPTSAPTPGGKALDEIAIFRLLMKQEEDKKRHDDSPIAAHEITAKSGKDDLASHQQRNGGEDSVKGGPAKPTVSLTSSLSSLEPPPTLKDTPTLASTVVGTSEHLQDRGPPPSRSLTNAVAAEHQVHASKPSGDLGTNSGFPPVGSRVLAMKNKLSSNASAPINIQNLNGGSQNPASESPQLFSKEPARSVAGFSPFEEQRRASYGLEDARDLPLSQNQGNLPQRLPIDQLFNSSLNSQAEANYNGSLNKGSRLAKIFENKTRDLPGPPPKPQMQGGYISPPPNMNHRQELGNFGGVSSNSGNVHSVEELVAMLNNSSQRNNHGHNPGPNPLSTNNGGFNQGPSLHALQQQHLQQQHLANNRMEPLYDSRAEDRSFVPDGMVPGLRTVPPPQRGRESLGHFNDLEEPMHYNLQRMIQQQQQVRNLEPLLNGPTAPLFNQQGGRHGGGLPMQQLQQPHFRGGPSPALNQTTANGPLQQRLPPGLANLGGRPPHDPSQFIGLPGPQHNIHGNGPLPQQQQIPFNNFNAVNIGLNNLPLRGPAQNVLLQGASGQQHHLGNLGHPGLDPRLSNHHHLMGLGGSGIGNSRINGGFPLQQGANGPNHLGMRPQQQQQAPHLLPHMLPHLMPPHMQQQGHPPSNNPQNHDLMALLMGGPHRE